MSRYTVYGSRELDERIDGHMELISGAVESVVPTKDLIAVVLGGGYGRGEGGVFLSEGCEELFNDYDMFVVVGNVGRSGRRKYLKAINSLRGELDGATGIDVDFGPLKTLDQLRRAPFWLFYYELKYGHKVVWGDEAALSIMPNFNGDDIPLTEGLKLLLNRAVGLMLARRKLREDAGSERNRDFITRNIFKAYMALGDAVLMMKKDYHYSYRKRLELMGKHKDDEIVRRLGLYEDYSRAMDFKLRPVKDAFDSSRFGPLVDAAISKFEAIYYLILGDCCEGGDAGEGLLQRIKTGREGRGGLAGIAKNVILNFRDCGLSNCSLSWFLKYPRYRLFFALPYVLFGSEEQPGQEICKALSISAGATKEDLENSFLRLWRRYE